MEILSQSNILSHNVLTAINFNLFTRFFNLILNSVTSPAFYNIYIKLPTQSTPLNPYISENPKFYPFFKGALGALDGTHICARPPVSARSCYRNHKSGVSQNVLTATTFNMHFCYILSGWEGSASDGGVFHDACVHDLELPDGKYYLADAGYPICDALLVPFHGVRYHPGVGKLWFEVCLDYYFQTYYNPDLLDRPQNYKELYNLRHSQAWNIVERIFGVAKKHFAIIWETNQYPMLTQAKIVSACGVTHNFIRTFDPDDMPEPLEPEDQVTSPALYTGELGAGSIGHPETCRASKQREDIANAMWLSYQMEFQDSGQV